MLFNEQFTGGASTTGFTIVSDESDCDWLFAPGGLTPNAFNRDFSGALPSGGGFDGDFAFLDSDECGATGISVASYLVSAPFDASGAEVLMLTFAHQFKMWGSSFAKVQVFNGSAWSDVATYNGDTGFPNPSVIAALDITSAAGGSSVAQVRFLYNSGWDWWWALDNISVTAAACTAPVGLAATSIGNAGAMISFTENGSSAYEWVVTDGAFPSGDNTLASGSATNAPATGLMSGTQYFVFVRSACAEGGFSLWSNAVGFWTLITNDDCLNAAPLTVNPDLSCAVKTQGTVRGATASGLTSTCSGTADDDVWFSFVATNTTHRISLTEISGSTTDMYHALWREGCGALSLVTGSCSDAETSNPTGLTPGQTYHLQVYTYTSTPAQTSGFKVCIGTDPAIGMAEQAMKTPLRLYPNPVKGLLNIDIATNDVRRIVLLDAAGRTVRQEAFQRTIDVQALDAGTYVMLALDADAHLLARAMFVKE